MSGGGPQEAWRRHGEDWRTCGGLVGGRMRDGGGMEDDVRRIEVKKGGWRRSGGGLEEACRKIGGWVKRCSIEVR